MISNMVFNPPSLCDTVSLLKMGEKNPRTRKPS